MSLLNQTIQEANVNSTTLKCNIASGYPAPTVTWYKDGAQLHLLSLGSVDDCRINGFHYIESDRPPFTRELLICKPNHVENTGIYRCEAKNIKGKDTSEAVLNVLGLYKECVTNFQSVVKSIFLWKIYEASNLTWLNISAWRPFIIFYKGCFTLKGKLFQTCCCRRFEISRVLSLAWEDKLRCNIWVIG